MEVVRALLVIFLLGFTYEVFGETSKIVNTDLKPNKADDSSDVIQNQRIELLEKEILAMKTKLEIKEEISTNKILKLEKELTIVNNRIAIINDNSRWKTVQSNQTHRIIEKRMLLPDCHCAGGVAFSASMVHHQENIGINQKVLFDNVITNVGNGFDRVTSTFKAPVSGTYYFTIVIMSHASEDIETEIIKNGIMLVRAYSGDSTTWNEGTQSVVVSLNVGDNVFVRIVDNQHINDGNVRVYGYNWSSFSGFLISK